MMLRGVFTFSLMMFSPLVFADSLDINLNNNAARFQYSSSAGVFIQGNSEFHIGALYNDVNNTMGEAGLIVRGGEENVPGLTVGIGAKALVGAIRNGPVTYNVSAIAIGGEIEYALPTAKRIAIIGEYFGGPKITTFADADRFNQSGVRLEYEITPQTKAYLGYREISFGIKSAGSAMLDSGTHVGVKISF